jgi:4-hydroxybenzoate polyprenyltransferase
MIRFEHTLFALPFALMGMILAAKGFPKTGIFVAILVCMASARSAAMAFNRLVDREFDARNPRTVDRALPAGRIGTTFVRVFVLVNAAIFVAGAWSLNALAGCLSPVALAIVFGYSYMKRWTSWCHAVLGLALAIAPMGAWIAVRGSFDLVPVLLSTAVVFWLIGFDTIYALQDEEFDRSEGLKSLPVRLGGRKALVVARFSHAAMVCCLGALGIVGGLGAIYATTVALVGAIIVWEHAMVSPRDLRKLNVAFFQANVAVSTVLLCGTALDLAFAGGAR